MSRADDLQAAWNSHEWLVADKSPTIAEVLVAPKLLAAIPDLLAVVRAAETYRDADGYTFEQRYEALMAALAAFDDNNNK